MKCEKGVTLIELLAAMAILLIISSLIYGVMIGVNNNYRNISGKNNLNQEANLILSTLKNYHIKDEFHETDGTYKIRYALAPKKQIFIGKTVANVPLNSDHFEVVKFIVDNIEITGNQVITKSSSKPLTIYIKLKNSKNQTYEIQSSFKKY